MKRLNPILRVSLYRYFGRSACDLPESIHPAIWILGWLYVVVSILFFVVWVIQWGSAHNQNDIIFSWGLNFILTDLNEVLIFSVVRIFFINVVAINFIQPYLAAFKVYLRDVEERPTASGIYQCIDPALIAADISGVLDLGAISDEDIYGFHTGKFSKTEEFKGYSECDPCDVTFVL